MAEDHQELPDEPLVIVRIPALVVLLTWMEEQKGSALTEEEVVAACQEAPAMALPASEAKAMLDSRGYRDLDPDHAWEEWQAHRQVSPDQA